MHAYPTADSSAHIRCMCESHLIEPMASMNDLANQPNAEEHKGEKQAAVDRPGSTNCSEMAEAAQQMLTEAAPRKRKSYSQPFSV